MNWPSPRYRSPSTAWGSRWQLRPAGQPNALGRSLRLLAHVRRSGSPRGAHDLIIAAHAAQTGRTILSRDAKARFGDLPGVTAIDA